MQTNPEQWAVELFKRLEKMVFQSPAGTCLDGEAIYVIQAAFAEREAPLVEALEAERIWHEEHDKAISKQPNANTGENGWRRMEHQERLAAIDVALKDRTHG